MTFSTTLLGGMIRLKQPLSLLSKNVRDLAEFIKMSPTAFASIEMTLWSAYTEQA